MEDPRPVFRPRPGRREHARGCERVVEGLLGLDEHGAVMSSRCFGGFDREQDAALGIDVEVRLRRGGQLAGRREACVVSRLAPEDERERGERRCRGGKEREPGERRPSSPARRRAAASAAVRASERNSRSPAVRARSVAPPKPRAAPTGPRAAGTPDHACVVPLPDGLDETPMEEQVLATLVDPPVQPVPLGQDRLVCDLDGGRARQWLAVEGEQTVLAVACEHLVERVGLELELAKLAATNPAPRVVRSRVGAHEAKEDLAAGCPRRWAKVCVETSARRPSAPTTPPGCEVALERQHVAGAVREQLGERVLQERQGARLVADVRDDLRRRAPARSERRPVVPAVDRLGELVLRRRRDRDRPGPEQLAELRVAEGAVEEVGAQRDEHARRRVVGRRPAR